MPGFLYHQILILQVLKGLLRNYRRVFANLERSHGGKVLSEISESRKERYGVLLATGCFLHLCRMGTCRATISTVESRGPDSRKVSRGPWVLEVWTRLMAKIRKGHCYRRAYYSYDY